MQEVNGIMVFDESQMARRQMQIKTNAYQHWCAQRGFSPNDDENWISFCEMYNNR